MYKAFKIDLVSLPYLGYSCDKNYTFVERNADNRIRGLNALLSKDVATLDGTALSELWFPDGEYDVFISHSHADINAARFLAQWLKIECGLNCFIDSDVWGNALDLLQKLNDRVCPKWENARGGVTYNYDQANRCAAHVFSMLSIAILNAMDRIECALMIKSGNSIPLQTAIQDRTYSPWLYEEVNFMNRIARKTPERIKSKRQIALEQFEKAVDAVEISHKVQLGSLITINSKDLIAMKGQKKTDALDTLYFRVTNKRRLI